MSRWPVDVARAYAACEALARSHYENFPVASRLLPPSMRPHVAAVYAFARTADDIADEGAAAPAARQAELDRWRTRLHAAVEDAADASPRSNDAPGAPDAVSRDVSADGLIALAAAYSIRSLDLPISLFDDLLSAFGQDTMTTRYASWDAVFDYCRRSANPVGRLVLRIAGYRNDALDRSSDALCTALQLTNFWQDFGRDFRAGRIYVPRDVQASAGALESALDASTFTPAWRRALATCIEVTRAQFDDGRYVCDHVRGRLGLELRATWHGGRRILDRVAEEPDLLLTRPTLTKADVPGLLWRAIAWPNP